MTQFLTFIFLLFLSLQNEISEVFDKLTVNENDSAIEVTDTVDSSSSCGGNESPQQQLQEHEREQSPIVCKKAERPSLQKNQKIHNHNNNNHGITKSIHDIDNNEWNSLAQFEKLIELEVENLETAAKNNRQQKVNNNNDDDNNTTATVSTTAVKNNILKPEKHVSVTIILVVITIIISYFYTQLNYAECSLISFVYILNISFIIRNF